MKKLYWRPKKVSRWAITLIALLALAGMAAVESFPRLRVESHQAEKYAAARLAQRGLELIKEERLRRGHQIVTHFDPSESGLIGDSMSLVTSVPGNLRSKQTSINPNFAAAVVDMLLDAGVQKGDYVAVGCSGSFPAMNLSVYAALETLEVKPVVLLSAAASQFGANRPDFMWVDMERELAEKGLVSFRAVASSLGGYEDRGMGMPMEARTLVEQALERNQLRLLSSQSLGEAIDDRMEIYRAAVGDTPVAAYINVGGGAASTGRTEGKKRYRPGLNKTPPATATEIDSVMTRFAKVGTPIIHLVEVNQLAGDLGLPEAPHEVPEVGTGSVFASQVYNRYLAAFLIVAIGVSLRWFVLTDGAHRLRQWLRIGIRGKRPTVELPQDTVELMV